MCGKGIIFIDTFYTIRVLSNFAGRAGYATFTTRRPAPELIPSCIQLDVKNVEFDNFEINK